MPQPSFGVTIYETRRLPKRPTTERLWRRWLGWWVAKLVQTLGRRAAMAVSGSGAQARAAGSFAMHLPGFFARQNEPGLYADLVIKRECQTDLFF
jgi:hypothetical protein